MAARPRKNNVSVPNLYPLYSRKVNKVYWRYKHPITGKLHALGTDEAEAIAIATELTRAWQNREPGKFWRSATGSPPAKVKRSRYRHGWIDTGRFKRSASRRVISS